MAGTAIVSFDFEEKPIRSMEIKGEPWFVLADVCRILEITNRANVAARLDEDERAAVRLTDSSSQRREVTVVSESGLYATILRSKGGSRIGTPAHRFRKFVTSELLPTLRRQGYYGPRPPAKSVSSQIALQNQLLRLTHKLQVVRNPTERRLIHSLVEGICQQLGEGVPALEELGKDAPMIPHVLERFFSLVRDLETAGYQINHHRKPDLLAINLVEIRELFKKERISFDMNGREFTNTLRLSTSPRFIENKAVNSQFDKKARTCWVFSNEP